MLARQEFGIPLPFYHARLSLSGWRCFRGMKEGPKNCFHTRSQLGNGSVLYLRKARNLGLCKATSSWSNLSKSAQGGGKSHRNYSQTSWTWKIVICHHHPDPRLKKITVKFHSRSDTFISTWRISSCVSDSQPRSWVYSMEITSTNHVNTLRSCIISAVSDF